MSAALPLNLADSRNAAVAQAVLHDWADRRTIVDDPWPSWDWIIADRATVTSAPPPLRSGTVSA